VTLTGHATVLLVADVERSTEYYRDALGFETGRWEVNPEHYGHASREGCHLQFARFDGARARPNHEEAPPDMFDVYLWVDDVEALHEELTGRGAKVVHGPVEQAYGFRELRVQDPDGYILGFGQPLSS
jgi:catechol 2,3-dioxygenase-like lactoylglutathione lyase family enzyme